MENKVVLVNDAYLYPISDLHFLFYLCLKKLEQPLKVT